MITSKKRVLVVGLDGATFDIITPLVRVGRLPTFAKLMKEGTWGNLKSTILPTTGPAWTSFMTGKNPGKHGVYGFYSFSKGTYETQIVTEHSIRTKKIWDYLDDERIGLLDIPLTFPPQEINGYMISGWPVPSEESIFTHPPELHTEIIREIGGFIVERPRNVLGYRQDKPIESLQNLYRYTDMRKEAALYLLRKKGPFDLFIVVFRGTDFIQHEAFKLFDEEYCKANPLIAKKFKEVIFQFYEKMDTILAELIQAMGNDAITIVMSDHGGGPMKKRFYINRWLKKEGFLSLKRYASSNSIHLSTKPFSAFLQKMGLSFFSPLLPTSVQNIQIPYPKLRRKHPSCLIDWKRTKAFANLTWTDEVIRINLWGREPEGIVRQEEYDAVREEIIEKLLGIVDPETGEAVIQRAYKREEIYHGPYVEDAPDILILTTETSYVFSPSLSEGVILERPLDPAPAPHRMEGIFFIHGEGIRADQVLTGLHIVDTTPTILYLMGKSIPDSMDGRVIAEAVEEEYFKKNPPTYHKEENGEIIKEQIEFSTAEQDSIKERLKALGYME